MHNVSDSDRRRFGAESRINGKRFLGEFCSLDLGTDGATLASPSNG